MTDSVEGNTGILNSWSLSLANPVTATYYVGSTMDDAANPPAATLTDCTTNVNTTCTLRDAIFYAASGADTILFNATGRGPITLSASNGPLTLLANVTITGPTSGAGVTVDGAHGTGSSPYASA